VASAQGKERGGDGIGGHRRGEGKKKGWLGAGFKKRGAFSCCLLLPKGEKGGLLLCVGIEAHCGDFQGGKGGWAWRGRLGGILLLRLRRIKSYMTTVDAKEGGEKEGGGEKRNVQGGVSLSESVGGGEGGAFSSEVDNGEKKRQTKSESPTRC